MKKNYIILITIIIIILIAGCAAPAPDETTITKTVFLNTDNDKSYHGLIMTKGLMIEGAKLIMSPYKIDLNGIFYQKDTSTDICNITAELTNNEWYAVTVNESNAQVGFRLIKTLTGWKGTNLADNQLNMLEGCYHEQRGYCYAADNDGNQYRIIGVFKSNAAGNGIDHLFDIKNVPHTNIQLNMNNPYPIKYGDNKIIFNNIVYDINSEYNKKNGETVLKFNQYIDMFSNIQKMTKIQHHDLTLGLLLNYFSISTNRIIYNAEEWVHLTANLNIFFKKNSVLTTHLYFNVPNGKTSIDAYSSNYCVINGN